MSERELSYADRVLRDAMLSVSGGFDVEVAGRAVAAALGALEQIAKELNARPFAPQVVRAKCAQGHPVSLEVATSPEMLARAGAHVAKLIDEVTRLVAFSKGQPDSRPGDQRGAGREILRLLTDEQLAQVQGWLEQAARQATSQAEPPQP